MTAKFKLLIAIAACLLGIPFNKLFAQDGKVSVQDSLLHKLVYIRIDQLPQPAGGLEEFLKHLSKTIKFPPGDVDYGGRVIVAFVVETNGKIDGERVIREPSGNKQIFSKQIFEIIKKIKWKPAKRNGKAVPFLYTLPVTIDVTE